jgi:hypothetical protein
MSKKKGSFDPQGLTVDYKLLGTISIEELAHAIVADLTALKEIYNIHYVTGPRLRLMPTNEYGEEVRIMRPTGGRVYRMDTHHYRPTCMDYEL